ncbi:hypothetical protein X777_14216 [Ooceraea biroi]|uniref:Uncharacterized protein n=1 Tax=Ooceraea biroi TaxID=2015173 RepID=A0A026VWK6_OOCBI|nr:hypothetical protein X777_14216 [Ooceraea biroi]
MWGRFQMNGEYDEEAGGVKESVGKREGEEMGQIRKLGQKYLESSIDGIQT